MQIFLVNPYYKPFLIGGAEYSLLLMATRFAQDGIDVHVVANAYDGDPRSFKENGVTVHLTETPVTVDRVGEIEDGSYLNSTAYVNRLAEVLETQICSKKNNFVWVIANNAQSFIAVSRLQGYFSGVRTVGIIRDAQLLCEFGVCMENRQPVSAVPCRGVKSVLICGFRFQFARYKVPIRHYLGIIGVIWRSARKRRDLRRALLSMSKIVVISDALKVVMNRVERFEKVPMQTVYNFSADENNTTDFTHIKRLLDDHGLTHVQFCLIAGKKSLGKGSDVAVSAWQQGCFNPQDIRLVFAGKGALQGAAPGVVDLPNLDNQVLLSLLPYALAVIVPGRCQEGLHRTKLDAIRKGIPVICTEAGGSSEGVVDGLNGFVVPSNDPLALAQAVARVAEWTDREWDTCRETSSEVFNRYFADDVILEKWKNFLKEK